MIKILYLPLNYSGNIQEGMYRAFNNIPNVNLRIFDFYNLFEKSGSVNTVRQEFINIVRDFQPDLVHMQLQMTNIFDNNSLIRAKSTVVGKKCIFTNWSGDVRNTASKEMVSISESMDVSLISSVGQLEMYKQAGCKNIRYWQIGYDPELFFPQYKKEFTHDLCFAGNYYAANSFADAGLRTKFILELKKKMGNRFAIYGRGYSNNMQVTKSLVGSEVNSVYNTTRCIFSMSNYNDVSSYFSDRLLTCMASGRPVISYRFPNYQNYFSDNSDILIANSVEEVISKVNMCIKNPDLANEIGYNGYLKVKSQHTYETRVIELLEMLNLL